MWIFAEYGYLLPTITEPDDPMRRHEDWNHYSNDGEFTFQVRARLREHLEYYLQNFGEEGTYGPIWRTPDHDYNYRVFTTQEAFAEAMRKSIMAINYRNFKDQSTKFPRGHEYHKLLLDVWADSADLGSGPGGVYGPYSEENPKGYKRAAYYEGWGMGEYEGRRIGDTFENIDFGDGDDGYWTPDEEEDEDWVEPSVSRVLEQLDAYGFDEEDWCLNLTPNEFDLVSHFLRDYFGEDEFDRMYRTNREVFNIEVVD
jgi:hypothetical protein